MNIRAALPSDIPQLVELLHELFSLETDFPFDPPVHAKGLELLLNSPSAHAWVAEEAKSGPVLGMITLQPHISTAFGCQDGIVEDLVVRRTFRGQGIGSALLKFAEQFALGKGLSRLRLAADPDNKGALEFYDRHGWIQGRLTNLYRTI